MCVEFNNNAADPAYKLLCLLTKVIGPNILKGRVDAMLGPMYSKIIDNASKGYVKNDF